MSDSFWQVVPAIIAAVFSGIALIIGALNGQKIAQNAVIVNATHKLVNSDHGVALRLTATTLGRIADLTNKPTDVVAATDAKTAADAHDATQRIINQEGVSSVAAPITT
jgi:hypothetical protein